MDKRAIVVLVVVFGGLFLVFFAFLLLAASAVRTPETRISRGPQVGVVEIDEMIMESGRIVEALAKFRDDARVRGVIVRVDSPGGAVAASQEINAAIRRVRDEKPVVVSMANMAASGGLYIAVAGTEVVANPGTITGSIGVITQITNLEGLAEWARIDVETLKVGELKDVGNPFRRMTEEERQFFLGLLLDIHDQFVEDVAEGRGMERETVMALADGRVLTGRQAHEAGLVDHLGGLDVAVDRIMDLADLPDRPALVYPRRDELQLLRDFFGTASRALAGGVREEVTASALGGSGPQVWFLNPAL